MSILSGLEFSVWGSVSGMGISIWLGNQYLGLVSGCECSCDMSLQKLSLLLTIRGIGNPQFPNFPNFQFCLKCLIGHGGQRLSHFPVEGLTANGRNASYLGCNWARTNVETAEARKQRQATLRDQWVQASSMENNTPPTGAPKAACNGDN